MRNVRVVRNGPVGFCVDSDASNRVRELSVRVVEMIWHPWPGGIAPEALAPAFWSGAPLPIDIVTTTSPTTRRGPLIEPISHCVLTESLGPRVLASTRPSSLFYLMVWKKDAITRTLDSACFATYYLLLAL